MTDRNRDGYRDWEVDTDDTGNTEKNCDNTSKRTRDKTYGHDGGRKGGNRQSGWFFGNHPD